MTYTVTFNPVLDYMAAVERLTLESINQIIRENIFYGGRGINVSALLANLGYRSAALGFIAGFTDREIERGVRSLGFGSDFIRVGKGMSRINVKLKSDQENGINNMGSEATDDDVERFFQKLSYLKKGDVLVLSGSISVATDNDIYQRVMGHLGGRGIRMAADTEKDLLRKVLQYHPFLIRSNNYELGRMFGQKPRIEEEIVLHARKLKEQGVVSVLVSMAGNGTMLVAEDGSVYRQGIARGAVKSSVGAGDSMVAGFIARYLEKGDYAYALKLEIAYGSVIVFSNGIGTKDETMKLLNIL